MSSFSPPSSSATNFPATGFSSSKTTTRRDLLFSLGGLYWANLPVMKKAALAAETKNPLTPINSFPLVLDKPICTAVSRPKKKRSKQEKEEEEEVLVIEGIELDRNVAVKFDVYVNDEDDSSSSSSSSSGTRPDKTEFAGSFVNVPHDYNKKSGKKMRTCLRLGITDLLEDLEAEGDDTLLVSLVPRHGTGSVSVGGINIEFTRD